VTKNEDTEALRELIEEVNRRAMRDEFGPHEVVELRELLPVLRQIGELLPQIKENVESHRRMRWLIKMIGMFFLAAPAAAAVGQGFAKFIEWIRGQ